MERKVTGRNIDWPKMKEQYLGWRSNLNRLTKELMTVSNKVELSMYNEERYFHHVHDTKHFQEMRDFWEREKRVPEEWIYKGIWPGIWTAMFHPCNTYSFAPEPIHIIRIYFKNGFFIYDRENVGHRKLWESWSGWSMNNPWRNLKNDEGMSLERRMRNHRFPSYKGFYQANGFGALIGYSDYISPVIVLEGSIERVEFLD